MRWPFSKKRGEAKNTIHNLATEFFSNETGAFPAIVLGLNVFDDNTASEFFDDVIEQFKAQRMCSPPETANLVVTMAGVVHAVTFRDHWLSRCTTDPILNHFTKMLVHADVLHIRGAELLDRASLLLNRTAH